MSPVIRARTDGNTKLIKSLERRETPVSRSSLWVAETGREPSSTWLAEIARGETFNITATTFHLFERAGYGDQMNAMSVGEKKFLTPYIPVVLEEDALGNLIAVEVDRIAVQFEDAPRRMKGQKSQKS